MAAPSLRIALCPGELAICRLPAGSPVPEWATGPFVCITRAAGEVSIVCEAAAVPPLTAHQAPYRALRIEGPLDFGLTGVLASVAGPLAEARVPVFAIATYDTDYVLVAARDLATACSSLRAAGHGVTASG